MSRSFIVASLIVASFLAAPVVADAATLTRGEVADGFDSTNSGLPPIDAAWREVALPDLWPVEHPGHRRVAWYRFPIEAPLAGGPVGVFLPHVEDNVEVYVDGHWVGRSGSRESISWNVPHFFSFAPELLGGATGTLTLRVEAYGAPGAGLRPFEVGDAADLRAEWRRLWWFKVGVTQVGTVLAVFAALLFGAIWIGKSHDPVYGWCAASAVCWGVNSLNYHVAELPMGFWAWKWLVHAGLDLFSTSTAFTVIHLVGRRAPRIEASILAFALLATGLPILSGPDRFFALANAFHGGSLLIGIAAGTWVIVNRRSLHPGEYATFVALSVVFNGFLVRDYAIQVGWIAPESPRLFHLTAPVLFSGFAITLLLRFITTYRQAERANAILEMRVQEKEEELQLHFARVSELERLHAVGAERERIMREMHDGMGGHLVSALSMVEDGGDTDADVADALRSSLDEMRLVIHSLDPAATDIVTLLGAMRSRLQPRLERAGVQFRWQVDDVPEIPRFGPEHHLHVLRIFQEAVTNVLKHSKASVVTVRTETTDDPGDGRVVRLTIEDDGQGGAGASATGRGIANMRHRAREIRGDLGLDSDAAGTRVELAIPVS